ncbi:hypothetical protein [Polyangium spumosum]|uniref:Uncharacterized protein n=1 Tax=Polyangium spumosum TaxID=889282 RepID=A0A6N7Q0G4_9BACT|nr:hypothetical protein [Polyangium spumosum]MRG95774.1 hypothetical protein [Polyangium spumosum]
MSTEEERVDQVFWEFAKASDALLVRSLKRTRTFDEVVDDHRRLEADFVARMADSAWGALEIKRRIAETILALAHGKHPPFEVCREAWNDLIRLGFTNIEKECTVTGFYADCCAYDEQPAEGLAVLEPLLAKLARGLDEAKAAQQFTEFYEEELERLGDIRDDLLAQQRGEQIPGRRTRRIDEARRSSPKEDGTP